MRLRSIEVNFLEVKLNFYLILNSRSGDRFVDSNILVSDVGPLNLIAPELSTEFLVLNFFVLFCFFVFVRVNTYTVHFTVSCHVFLTINDLIFSI